MKNTILSLLLSLAFFAGAKAEGLKSGDLVAICGDSITEQKLYSFFMEEYLLMCQPAPDLQAMQFGWGGETSWGFFGRMQNDVMPFKPTVATTCYGMNDGGYKAMTPETETNYRKAMQDIVKTFKDGGVRFLVVGSPGVVDSDTYKKNDPKIYNETLAGLGKIAKEVAEANGAAFADVNGVMMEVMGKAKARYGAAYDVAGKDGVHPSPNGHLVMAYAFLKALGCSGNIGTITVDQGSGKATGTEGHEVLSSGEGKVEIKSSRYPFCLSGDPANPASTSGVAEFFPFNQDLNRFMLVVKNAPAGKLKVTWGSVSKEFSTDDLEKGVNLAAEFLENPFSKPFADAGAAIKKQQEFETPAIKGALHSLINWRQIIPDNEQTYQAMAEGVLKKSAELRAASRAAVVPVTHTILIEAVK
jgi:hypothetical protein